MRFFPFVSLRVRMTLRVRFFTSFRMTNRHILEFCNSLFRGNDAGDEVEILKQITGILSQVRPQDIFDILIVAFIIYHILLLIKGTKAVQMLTGLGILLLALLISNWAELYTIDWIVQSFWAQIVIVIIVLFQPELRRALAHIGESPFFYSLSPVEESRFLEEIVKASVSLANKRIGALLVLERETDLKNFTEMGTELDAKVSREMILSIFHPTSPIHDGAIIIRGNRIVAAGCFLPLSLSAELTRAMGTRHRAALGITEETDAVVIIVSEETGTISLSMGGKIIKDLDILSLREELSKIFIKAKKETKRRGKS
jgi:diadenylate cyclase